MGHKEYAPVLDSFVSPPPGLVDDGFMFNRMSYTTLARQQPTLFSRFHNTGELLKAAAAFAPPTPPTSYHPWGDVNHVDWHRQAFQRESKGDPCQSHRFVPRRKKRHCPLLLGTHLKQLDQENPSHIVI